MREKREGKATLGKACRQRLGERGLTGPTSVNDKSYSRRRAMLSHMASCLGTDGRLTGCKQRQVELLLKAGSRWVAISPPDFLVSTKL